MSDSTQLVSSQSRFFSAITLLFLLMVSTLVFSQDSASIPVELPAQPLSESLGELGNVFGVTVIAANQPLDGVRAPAVSGMLTIEQAIERLLVDSNLSYRRSSTGAVLITEQAEVIQAISDEETIESDSLKHIELDRLTVTGERVERSLQDTNASVVLVSANDLLNRPADTTTEDLLQTIANVVTFGSSNEAPVVRGQETRGPVGGALATFTGVLPRATTIVDGRPLSFNEYVFGATTTWDIDTVEVFRGPQTTSQGVNSIAGAIFVRTADPVFNYESSAQARVSSFDGYQTSAMLNIPLSDQFALRAAVDYQRRDIFIDYNTPNQQLIDEAEFVDQLSARVKARWEPVAIPDLSLQLTYTHTDSNRPQTELVDEPFDNLERTNNPRPPAFPTQSDSVIAYIEYAFSPNIRLRNRSIYSSNSADRILAIETDGRSNFDGEEWSNETTLNADFFEGRLNAIVGLYYRDIEEDSDFLVDFGLGPFLSDIVDEKQSFGVFTELRYQLSPQFDLTAGVRYQSDEQQRGARAFIGSPIESLLDYDERFDAILPKFAIGYTPNSNTRMGFQISKGFNPGGVGVSANALFGGLPMPFFDFDEETLWNYELFLRLVEPTTGLILTANAFYTDFDDTQRTTTTLVPVFEFPDILIENAEQARSAGLELDLRYDLTPSLSLNAGIGLLHTEFEEFTDTLLDVEGNRFRFAPEITANIGMNWQITEPLSLMARARYIDDYFSDDVNSDEAKIDGYGLVDLALNYRLNDRFSLFAYANNVFDSIEAVNILLSNTGRVASTTVPRELGLGAVFRW